MGELKIRPMDIKKVIKCCRHNDRKGQEFLYNAYYSRYFTLCKRYLKSSCLAEEAVNEGFLKVFSNIHSIRDEKLFEGWMKRIFINTCLSELRKKKDPILDKEEEKVMFLFVDRNADSGLSNLELEELLSLVVELPDKMREVFNLYTIDGYKHMEIAEMLGISTNTSKAHLHQAKLKLKEKLENLQRFEDGSKKHQYG